MVEGRRKRIYINANAVVALPLVWAVLLTWPAFAQRLEFDGENAFVITGDGKMADVVRVEAPVPATQRALYDRLFMGYYRANLRDEVALGQALRLSSELGIRHSDWKLQNQLLEEIDQSGLQTEAVLKLLARIFQEGADDPTSDRAAGQIRHIVLLAGKGGEPPLPDGFTPDAMMGPLHEPYSLNETAARFDPLVWVGWAFGEIDDEAKEDYFLRGDALGLAQLSNLVKHRIKEPGRGSPLAEVAAAYIQSLLHSRTENDHFTFDFASLKLGEISLEEAAGLICLLGRFPIESVYGTLWSGLHHEEVEIFRASSHAILMRPSSETAPQVLSELKMLLAIQEFAESFRVAWSAVAMQPWDPLDAAVRAKTVFDALLRNQLIRDSHKKLLLEDFFVTFADLDSFDPAYVEIPAAILEGVTDPADREAVARWVPKPGSFDAISNVVRQTRARDPRTVLPGTGAKGKRDLPIDLRKIDPRRIRP